MVPCKIIHRICRLRVVCVISFKIILFQKNALYTHTHKNLTLLLFFDDVEIVNILEIQRYNG